MFVQFAVCLNVYVCVCWRCMDFDGDTCVCLWVCVCARSGLTSSRFSFLFRHRRSAAPWHVRNAFAAQRFFVPKLVLGEKWANNCNTASGPPRLVVVMDSWIGGRELVAGAFFCCLFNSTLFLGDGFYIGIRQRGLLLLHFLQFLYDLINNKCPRIEGAW